MNGPLHIAILIDSYVPIVGGAQQVVHQVASRLVRRGFAITVLTRRVTPDLPAEETRDGVRVLRLGEHPKRVVSKLRCMTGAVRWLRRHREVAAVLAVPTALVTDLLPAYLACRATGTPYAVRATALNMFDGMLTWRSPTAGRTLGKLLTPPPLWRAALRNAHAIVAQSQPVYDRIRSYGLDNATLCVGGADPARFRPASPDERAALRDRLGLPRDRVVFITTGRYVPEKNHLAFLQALGQLHREADPPPTGIVLGGTEKGRSDETERQLKRYAAEHGLADAARFHENVRNVEDYLRAADVFVQPTHFDEGLSNALLEAMMCGLPLVASDIPQTAAALPSRESAILVPPRDADALTAGMRRMMKDAALRSRSGEALGAHAERAYSLERVVTFYDGLLRDLAAKRPRLHGNPA